MKRLSLREITFFKVTYLVMVQPRLASSSLPMACAHIHSNGTPCNGFWDNHGAREEDETAVLLLVLGLTAGPEGSACRSVFKGL